MGAHVQRKKATLRTVAATAAVTASALVSLTACGTGLGDSDEGRKNTSGGGTSNSDEGKPKSTPETKPTTPAALQFGEASPEPVSMTLSDRTAQFEVTMEKIVVGKPGDLEEFKDAEEYAGKVPVWLYATYEHVGGQSLPGILTGNDLRMTVEGGEPARQLLVIGEMSSSPADCQDPVDVDDVKVGESKTICVPFIAPEDKDVQYALLSRGFTEKPTRWETD